MNISHHLKVAIPRDAENNKMHKTTPSIQDFPRIQKYNLIS